MAKMDDIELHSIVQGEMEQAVNYHDTEFAADRIDAMNYYLGEPLGNERDGRSKVIQTEVADVIDGILPQLVKIFTTTDDFVKFEPRGPEDVEAAKQATEYVNFILNADNDGWLIFHHWMKDALISKAGIVKSYFDEKEIITEDSYEGLSEEELTALLMDEEIEILEQEAREVGEPQITPDGQMMPMVFDIKVRKTTKDGRVKIENIPPEEFLFNQRAKDLDDCRFVAHRTEMTVSDLVSMGYDQEEIERYAGYTETDTLNEKQARFQDLESAVGDESGDPSMRDVLVTEVYIKIDYNNDGKASIRRLLCVGSSYEILENEPYYMFPFSVISPILMPHRLIGRSVAELVMDLQQSKTAILRQCLDNLYLQNNARVGVVEGQVNIDDVISARPGGVVRMRAPGMVQPLTTPSVAEGAFPLLSYMDQVREMRTGLSKASMGLDPDALQSSTATAVAATVSAAQAKVEMIARVFAETGVKRLMKCILQLVQKHQQQPRMVRLRNTFVPMDPQMWDNEFDVSVNVGLGNGDDQQKAAMLAQVAAKQEQVLTQMGMDNPLCTMGQYRNTLQRMLEASGHKDIDNYFLDPDNLPPELQQKIQQKMQAPQNNEEQQKLQLEKMKVEAELQLAREKMMAELELKKQEMEMKNQLRMKEMEFEAQLRSIEASSGTDISTNIPRA
tara:strand:- start:2081 stop:4105 length:2025 start_codon:yes stop_codon:yes gene_type:complete